ncbi:hypothetical protein QQP08_005129 [Theobroma cacao]|nr:hypothetical protein QQP08_005129 [Theobroma cacao]
MACKKWKSHDSLELILIKRFQFSSADIALPALSENQPGWMDSTHKLNKNFQNYPLPTRFLLWTRMLDSGLSFVIVFPVNMSYHTPSDSLEDAWWVNGAFFPAFFSILMKGKNLVGNPNNGFIHWIQKRHCCTCQKAYTPNNFCQLKMVRREKFVV